MLGSVQPGRCLLIHGLREQRCSATRDQRFNRSRPDWAVLMSSRVFLFFGALSSSGEVYPAIPAVSPGRLAVALVFLARAGVELRSGS